LFFFSSRRRHTRFSRDWSSDVCSSDLYTNRLSLFSSIRGNSLVPFGEGWGWMTINPRLWSNWDDSDPRKVGSILEVGNPDQGTQAWSDPGNQDHFTRFYNKKYTALQYPNDLGTVQGMFLQLYDWGNADMQ